MKCKSPCLLCEFFHSSITAGLLFFLILLASALLYADLPWADLP